MMHLVLLILVLGMFSIILTTKTFAVDTDGDEVIDSIDNCPTVFNPDQEDSDEDFLGTHGYGDLCDPCPWSIADDCNTNTVIKHNVNSTTAAQLVTGDGKFRFAYKTNAVNGNKSFTVEELDLNDPDANFSRAIAIRNTTNIVFEAYAMGKKGVNIPTAPNTTVFYAQGSMVEGGAQELDLDIAIYFMATNIWLPINVPNTCTSPIDSCQNTTVNSIRVNGMSFTPSNPPRTSSIIHQDLFRVNNNFISWNDNAVGNWTKLVNSAQTSGNITCGPSTGCNIESDNVSTRGVSSINVTFKVMDDDCDLHDVHLFFWGAGKWREMADIDAETLGRADDAWFTHSVVTTNASFFRNNFSIRFWANLGTGENYWIDHSQIKLIYTDSTDPVVTLNGLANQSIVSSATQYLSATFTDNNDLYTSTLYVWNSTGKVINETRQRKQGTSNSSNISVILPYPGVFTWSFYVCDRVQNCAWNTAIRTLTYSAPPDTKAPHITLIAPSTASVNGSKIIKFKFTPRTNDNYANCSIWTNTSGWNVGTKNTSVIGNNSVNTITHTFAAIGWYKWNAECSDKTGNHNFSSTNRTINIQSKAPISITLVAPSTGSINKSKTIKFKFTPISSNGYKNCSVWTNTSGWNIGTKNTSVITNNSVNTITHSFTNPGWYKWNAECTTQGLTHNFSTTNRTIYFDASPPTITLIAPGNADVNTSLAIKFKFTPKTNDDYQNCSIWTNTSGWNFGTKNTSVITNNSVNTIIHTFTSLGWYKWNAECSDRTGNHAFSATNRTIRIKDGIAPRITLIAPGNNDVNDSLVIKFKFTPRTNDDYANCSVWTNTSGWNFGTKNASVISNNSVNTITHTFSAVGDYKWNAECSDRYGNHNFSTSNRTITVDNIGPFYNNNGVNTTIQNYNAYFYLKVNDTNIHKCIFSTNATGTWDNQTPQNLNSFSSWCNSTAITLYNGLVSITYRYYLNDTAGNKNNTAWFSFITTLSNLVPTISKIYTVDAQDPVENNYTRVSMKFRVSSLDGVDDMNVSSAKIKVNMTGGINRSSIAQSCLKSNINSTNANITCNVSLWWFDKAGKWTINASINDNSSESAENNDLQFTFNTLKSIKISPHAIGFGKVLKGQTDIPTTTGPIYINNTGNTNISYGKINVTGKPLHGIINDSLYLPAGNFTVNVLDAANGDALVNSTEVLVTSSVLPAGNHSLGGGAAQEDLYFYLEIIGDVVAGKRLTAQIYDTTLAGVWIIGAT